MTGGSGHGSASARLGCLFLVLSGGYPASRSRSNPSGQIWIGDDLGGSLPFEAASPAGELPHVLLVAFVGEE
jgi:hypothetical protein